MQIREIEEIVKEIPKRNRNQDRSVRRRIAKVNKNIRHVN